MSLHCACSRGQWYNSKNALNDSGARHDCTTTDQVKRLGDLVQSITVSLRDGPVPSVAERRSPQNDDY